MVINSAQSDSRKQSVDMELGDKEDKIATL